MNLQKISYKSDWLLSAVLSFIFLCLSGSALFQSLELKAYDSGVRGSHRDAGNEVVIIAIDDKSIANIGRWPWSRDVQAKMLDKLSASHPKVIGDTVFFLEPQIPLGLDYLNQISYLVTNSSSLNSGSDAIKLNALIIEAQQGLNTDAKLASSIKSANNIVLGMPFILGEPLGNADKPLPDYVTRNALSKVLNANTDAWPIPSNAGIPPIKSIGESAVAIGHLNTSPDIDGAIRLEPLVISYFDQFYPSMALQIVARYLNIVTKEIKVRLGEGVQIGKLNIATNDSMQMNTFFYADNADKPAFSVDSYFDVLNGNISTQKYAGKIVLIGTTASGIGDNQVTPISANMQPIETLAQTVASILNEDFFIVPHWAKWGELAVWLGVALYLILLLPQLKAASAALISGAILLTVLITQYSLMTQKGWWLQLMMPATLLIVGHALLTTKRYLMIEKDKQKSNADSAESNRNLALMFQSQGQLDMAFDRFRKCPIETSVMDGLYNLGLDFERKRQFNKAEAVFAYMSDFDIKYKDLAQRINRAKQMAETVILGGTNNQPNESTLVLNNQAIEKPMLGRYQIEKELGKGAMGTVYLGRDPKINRVVAIKTLALANEFDAEELIEVKARFFREAETAGRLNHPNIVTIYDAGEDHDLAFIAMEFLKGEDLSSYTKPNKLLPVNKAIEIVIKVTEALNYAHEQNVVHRDIKPSNIMIELDTDLVKVTDFGIARIADASKTKTGIVLGTPSYMSPEQIAGKKIDGRSDLFSLGITFYSLLTGTLPFTGDSMASLMYKITNEAHADIRHLKPQLPDMLAMIVNQLLEKKLENRYQTGRQLVNDLNKCLVRPVKI